MLVLDARHSRLGVVDSGKWRLAGDAGTIMMLDDGDDMHANQAACKPAAGDIVPPLVMVAIFFIGLAAPFAGHASSINRCSCH